MIYDYKLPINIAEPLEEYGSNTTPDTPPRPSRQRSVNSDTQKSSVQYGKVFVYTRQCWADDPS